MSDTLQRVLLDAARAAGDAILAVRREAHAHASTSDREALGVRDKDDGSPVTRADMAAHAVIHEHLSRVFPGIPQVSEEGGIPSFAERSRWDRLFLIDPLDGTREFIRGSDEFAVCIALVVGDTPVYGVVHAPARGLTGCGGPESGSVLFEADSPPVDLRVRPPAPGQGRTLLTSRSHPSPDLERALARWTISRRIPCGSALKFILMAQGHGDMYARTGRTCEWDTAAGQALLLGAGGHMTTLEGRPMVYNKADLANPGFIAWS